MAEISTPLMLGAADVRDGHHLVALAAHDNRNRPAGLDGSSSPPGNCDSRSRKTSPFNRKMLGIAEGLRPQRASSKSRGLSAKVLR